MKTGIEQISEERLKQIAKHSYIGYKNKELLLAAMTYLRKAMLNNGFNEEETWPFEKQHFNNEGYVENLKKAGAFIAAELDRLNIN